MKRHLSIYFKKAMSLVFHAQVLFSVCYMVYFCLTGTVRAVGSFFKNWDSFIHQGDTTIYDFCLIQVNFHGGAPTSWPDIAVSALTPFFGVFLVVMSVACLLKMLRFYFKLNLRPRALQKLSETYHAQVAVASMFQAIAGLIATIFTLAATVYIFAYIFMHGALIRYMNQPEVQTFVANYSFVQTLTPLVTFALMNAYLWLVYKSLQFIAVTSLKQDEPTTAID